MPAPRVIKPEFFLNEDLYNAEMESGLQLRLAYAGLWTACDREGRFRWQPRRLGRDVLPYDDVEFSDVLDRLAVEGYVVRYSGRDIHGNPGDFGVVPKFKLHQHINNKEPASELPAPPEGVEMREPGRRRSGPRPGSTRLTDLLNNYDPANSANAAAIGEKIDAAEKEIEASHVKFVLSGGTDFRVEEGMGAVMCAAKGDMSDVVVTIDTCQKGVSIGVSEEKAMQYTNSYMGLDVVNELKKIRQWSIDNPQKRKTAIGMPRFINSWMGNAQNSPGRNKIGSHLSVVPFSGVNTYTQSKEDQVRAKLNMGPRTDNDGHNNEREVG